MTSSKLEPLAKKQAPAPKGSPRLAGKSEQAACDQDSASEVKYGAENESRKFYASQYRTFYELETLRSCASLKTLAEKRSTLAHVLAG